MKPVKYIAVSIPTLTNVNAQVNKVTVKQVKYIAVSIVTSTISMNAIFDKSVYNLIRDGFTSN